MPGLGEFWNGGLLDGSLRAFTFWVLLFLVGTVLNKIWLSEGKEGKR